MNPSVYNRNLFEAILLAAYEAAQLPTGASATWLSQELQQVFNGLSPSEVNNQPVRANAPTDDRIDIVDTVPNLFVLLKNSDGQWHPANDPNALFPAQIMNEMCSAIH